MKNIKLFLIIPLIFVSTTSFAAWTQPTATPPAGNTLPPINVSGVLQRKTGVIEAYGFCIIKSDGTRDCLGSTSTATNPATPTNGSPWIFSGNNIENTNDETLNNGNINIKDSGSTYNWIFNAPLGKLNVEGLVKAVGFCLGNDCIKTGTISNTSKTSIFNSWEDLIKNYSGVGTGDVLAGTPKTNNFLTKWTNVTTKTIANSKLYDDGTYICIGAPDSTKSNCIKSWSDIKGDLTINNVTNTNKLVGTTGRIVKFTGTNSIGDSGFNETSTMIESDKLPLKATKGLIIPKTTSDTNTWEEGAIWLNTSVVVQ